MYPFQSKLSGCHMLVTGGTKGIGRAIVEAYLAEGANVSYCARTVRGDEFSHLGGGSDTARAVGTAVDISQPEEIKAWVAKAAQEFGRIDSVAANASPLIFTTDAQSWERSFHADIMGLIHLIEATVPHLTERAKAGGFPSVVVTSSLAGFEARHPAIACPYSTLKRAQATLAKDYSRKLAPLGIRINTVLPGSIENPSITLPDGTVELSNFQIIKREQPEFYQSLLDAVPMKRTGRPEEVANLVVFLSSHLASYLCGANLLIDGGMALFL